MLYCYYIILFPKKKDIISFVISNHNITNIDLMNEKIHKLLLDSVERKKTKLELFKSNYILNNPVILYQNYMKELNNFLEKLELLNPISVLKKGYSLTYYNGTILSSIQNIKKDTSLNIRLFPGKYIITSIWESLQIGNTKSCY